MAEKKSKDKAKSANWHPDFRDNLLLPDVKVVRTNFLVNFVALALALAMVGWLVINEVRAAGLKSSTAELREKVAAGEAKDGAYNRLSKQFSDATPKAEDLAVFFKDYEPPLPLLLAVAQSKPTTISLQSISVGYAQTNTGTPKKPKYVYSPRIVLNGVLKGSNVDELGALDEYRAILENYPFFKERMASLDVSKPNRNPNQQLFEFTIVINLKSE